MQPASNVHSDQLNKGPAFHPASATPLSVDVSEHVDDLRGVHKAFNALSMLVANNSSNGQLHVKSDELTELLRIVNSEFGRCINSLGSVCARV